MPWCPECHTEYREGYTMCRNCEVELIEELQGVKRDRIEKEDLGYEEWVHLVSCSDDQEADIIESIMAGENIVLLRKYKGASE